MKLKILIVLNRCNKKTNLDFRSTSLIDDVEGPMFLVVLDNVICVLSANKTLGIEDCVARVHCDLKRIIIKKEVS